MKVKPLKKRFVEGIDNKEVLKQEEGKVGKQKKMHHKNLKEKALRR